MAKKVRTAKGNVIDFDLFKIKQQMGNVPKTVEVKTREDFIERKLRRLRRKAEADAKKKVAQDNIPDAPVEPKQPAQKRKLQKKKQETSTDEGTTS